MFEETQYGQYWKSSALSFWLLYFLTIFPLTGFIGADHFYARSYKTGLAKLIFNMVTFGFWYVWDALTIIFDSDRVRTFGFNIPFYGPAGIGAGQFAGDAKTPNADKAGRMFIYALLVLIAPLGIDYFYVGNTSMGLFKLLCTISIIFLPLALLLGLWNIIRLYFFPGAVMDQYNEFFGSTPSPGYDPNAVPFGLNLEGLYTIPVIGDALRLAETTIGTATTTVETAATTVAVAGETAQEVLKAVGESAQVVSNVSSAVKSVTPEKFEGALNNAIATAKNTQQGGGTASILTPPTDLLQYALPTALIAVLVFGLTSQIIRMYRSNVGAANTTQEQRGGQEKNDTPPRAGSA